MKRQPIEWEQIFINDMINKGFLSDICKQLIKININKQANNLTLKMGRRAELTFFQGKWRCQQAHEKVLNISNRQGNADQNHNELSLHTCQNGYHQMLMGVWRKWNLYCWWECKSVQSLWKISNSTAASKKAKIKNTTWHSDFTSRYRFKYKQKNNLKKIYTPHAHSSIYSWQDMKAN